MKSNLLPALIVALAIVFTAVYSDWATRRATNGAFLEAERVVSERDASGKTRLSLAVENTVASVIEGFRNGMKHLDEKPEPTVEAHDAESKVKIVVSKAKELFIDTSAIEIRDTQIVDHDFPDQERVIGIVRNGSSTVVRKIHVNLQFRAGDGRLIDVMDDDRIVTQPLGPNQERGFVVYRSLGNIEQAVDELRANKANRVVIVVTRVVGEEKEGEPGATDNPDDAQRI
jgi:hypothetical protein